MGVEISYNQRSRSACCTPKRNERRLSSTLGNPELGCTVHGKDGHVEVSLSLQEFAGLPTAESCRRSPFYSRQRVCRQDFPIPVGKPLSEKILSANRTSPTGIRAQSASFRRQPCGLSAKEQCRQLGCRSVRRQPGLSANPHFADNQGCWQSQVCRQLGLLAK